MTEPASDESQYSRALAARLKALRSGKSQQEFADMVGVNINTWRGYEKGHRTPGADTISDLCQKTGASSSWVLWGEGDMYGPAQSKSEPVGHGQVIYPSGMVAIDGLIMVPKVAARLSAGGGSFEAGSEVRGLYAFRADWLRAKGKPEDMVLMEVSGDSMEPELRDGDTVLINQGQSDILAGKVYAVGIEDTVVVKQVERLPGVLVLRSANPAYKSREIDMRGDLAATVRIIGRVIWWCHEAR
jgi:phage repressor protein C with HTH and peptisase S24 domain